MNKTKFNLLGLIMFAVFMAFSFNPIFGFIIVFISVILFVKKYKYISTYFADYLKSANNLNDKTNIQNNIMESNTTIETINLPTLGMPIILNNNPIIASSAKRLEKRKKYLHIALNNTMGEAQDIISRLPTSDRILIEVGTPLIKIYGVDAISQIKRMAPFGTYIVADNKCADLAPREVEMMVNAGANASTCLGVAPIETINSFIEECDKYNIDSMIDMMNVENPLEILKKLKKLPDVVMIHRGVDESEFSKEKQIPYYQIKQIKGNYDVMVAVAGGDTPREVQRAIFNDADIVVVWENFYQSNAETTELAQSFLQEIK